ncbi:DDE superfamily endonuclease domain-containing protein [Phthorimaea operculella]|nr:DDE superfamily endonuclease domain-containing protein [Phthorimaea operculella]
MLYARILKLQADALKTTFRLRFLFEKYSVFCELTTRSVDKTRNLGQPVDFVDDEDQELLEFIEIFQIRDIITPRVRVNPFELYNDVKFKQKYRFSKCFADKIVDIVKNYLPSDSRGGTIHPQIQVACALRYWARHQIQDDSGDMHGISQQAVSVIAKNVAEALAKRAHLFINMPTLLEDQQDVIRGFRNICGFPSVIGAIDCTHIKIKRVGGEMSEAYVNRKGYYSINTQVVCDADLKIRDIVARWRGSAHDSRIFNESSLKRRLESGEFHGRLLGDSGYACTDKLFTPVRNPADHREEAYNRAHIRTRNTVERCFGLFKQRFRCLLRGMYMKLSTAKTTIVALAVLHNIAIDMKEQIDIVTYVRQRTRRVRRDTVRGAIIRRNFINQHF